MAKNATRKRKGPKDKTKGKAAAEPEVQQAPPPPARTEPATEGEQFAMPERYAGEPGAEILIGACEMFGLNPDPDIAVREILGWKHYPETPTRPESIRLVSGGGRALRVWADPDKAFDDETMFQLREIFGAWGMDREKKRVPLPLPDDLTLTYEAATGHPASDAHVYRRGGYLREGAKKLPGDE